LALVLGLVLLASGLYVWRRPSAAADPSASEGGPPTAEDSGAPLEPFEAGPPSVVLSGPRVIGCHDRGPKVTPPDECDRLGPIATALSRAIEQSIGCYPATTEGGTIEYVVDVSFSRRRVRVTLPRSGRSTRDRRLVSACATAVREAMQGVDLDGISHEHARYQIAVTATYRGKG
jgi:hypothetical protein